MGTRAALSALCALDGVNPRRCPRLVWIRAVGPRNWTARLRKAPEDWRTPNHAPHFGVETGTVSFDGAGATRAAAAVTRDAADAAVVVTEETLLAETTTFARADKIFSVTEKTFGESAKVLPEPSIAFLVSPKPLSTPDVTLPPAPKSFPETEKILAVAGKTLGGASKTLAGEDKTFPKADFTLPSTGKTLSVMDKVLSAAPKGMEMAETAVYEPERPIPARRKGPFNAQHPTPNAQRPTSKDAANDLRISNAVLRALGVGRWTLGVFPEARHAPAALTSSAIPKHPCPSQIPSLGTAPMPKATPCAGTSRA